MLFVLALLQSADPLAVIDDDVRPAQDVLHYEVRLSLPASGDEIRGATRIVYRVSGGTGPLVLDFDEVFAIDSIVPDGAPARGGRVADGRLAVDHWGRPGETLAVTIHYHGSPQDGLFIQDNVHGTRTAFADNWPDRAHHWFPSEDHPSDKATVTYAVEAPNGWRVIANGRLAGVDTLSGGRTRWHWGTDIPIPVYTMVVGAGPLSVTPFHGAVPQSLWTFREDSAYAVEAFRRIDRMMEVYEQYIGPFSYEKLAHVQSSTRFGGMENSSAIFYSERAYANRTVNEGTIAHETVHQWFGDSATEADWHHLWLSEGFASYFSPVFYELIGEHDAFRAGLQRARNAYLASDDVHRPVIDPAEADLFALLNRNNYQKGALILHMLRRTVGDSAFFRGVREYYADFRDSVALSRDFMTVAQRYTHVPLRPFFEQWLLQPGYPQVEVTWTHDAADETVVVTLTQEQPDGWGTFELDVPVEVDAGRAKHLGVASFGGGRMASVRFEGVAQPPRAVRVDPAGDYLITIREMATRP